jgi:predicted ATPase/class 3 adenylate cyclase
LVPTGSGSWYPRSFVLTDIVGSVSLWERDADQMAKAVARHDDIIRREVTAAGGTLVRAKGEGDSTFSVFTHPAAAVAAAAAVQRAVSAAEWRTTEPLRVRVGVHTGDCEPRDGDWYGPAVNRAARLRSLAAGGQTLVSGVTAGLVADQVPDALRLLYRGRRVLRGIERPEEVWELAAADDPRLAPPMDARAGSLPVAQTRLVGRAADLDHLAQLVEHERLVTLTGPGGSGKTRLAMELARHATCRGEIVWLAELVSLRDGELVAQSVAAAVGVETGPNLLDDLLARSEALTGLLLLDNCEHLLDACAALIDRLLAEAPDIRILTTSREPLGLAGEQEWPVRPLDVPNVSLRDRDQLAHVESVELLLERARAVRPDLEVGDDDVTHVVSICRALDGIPLAIELAAGRLRSLGLADLAARLADQLKVLARRRSAGPDETRHQTLRLTLDWSYDLLTDEQQRLARRLSVFAGGFRLDAAEAVCGGDLDVLDGVDELVAKSLVSFDGVTARYRLLEPLRQYLAERLDEAGETEAIQRIHAQWVARLCHQLGTRLLDDQRARSSRLGEETYNIDLALRWAHQHDHRMAHRIVGSLGDYWSFYDQPSGRRWCNAVMEIGTGVDVRTRAKALLSAGMVAQTDGDFDPSVARLREALAIYRAAESSAGQAVSLFWLGRALVNKSDLQYGGVDVAEGTRCFEESLRLHTDLNDLIGAGWCRTSLSFQAAWDGDLDRAEQLARQVVDECRATRARHPVGQALAVLAYVARRRGHGHAALALLQEAEAIYRDIGDRWQLSGILIDLSAQHAAMGRGAEALQALAEASRVNEQIGRLSGRWFLLAVAAFAHLANGESGSATSALGGYDAHAEATGWGRPDRRGNPRGGGGYIRWLDDVIESTRGRLDPTEVTAAAAAAHGRNLDELIDELIIQPASAAAAVASDFPPDDR